MKSLIGFLLLWAAVMMGALDVMAIEEAKYEVLRVNGSFEIRDYSAHIVAETIVVGNIENAGSKAFRSLFGYISGDNQSQQKMAMTAPVSQQVKSEMIKMTAPVGQERDGKSWVVSFRMPAEFSMETLPIPGNPAVVLRRVPERRMAVVRYSGFWSKKAYLKNKMDLEAWISENGLEIAGSPVWARFNPPFTPWFLRRNEVLIPIAEDGNRG